MRLFLGRRICYFAPTMKDKHRTSISSKLRLRIGLAIAGLMVLNSGILALLRGKLHYQNFSRAWVFSPYGILIGALVILMVIRLGKQHIG
jgi:hypothetical protein